VDWVDKIRAALWARWPLAGCDAERQVDGVTPPFHPWYGPPSLLLLAAGLGCAASAGAPPEQPAPGAAPTIAPSCERGDTALVREVLYFGRNRPDGGVVSDAEWQEFLDSVVTPSFPQGLTVVDAHGQWRGRSGTVERERAEVVTLFHPGDPAGRRAVDQLVGEYKRRFGQEAVLRERGGACVAF
jgi:hypothetical protein